jgi:transposase InsO family protein
MSEKRDARYQTELSLHRKWGLFRHAVVGHLLTGQQPRGELCRELDSLAAKHWLHPINGAEIQFGRSTIEEWYYKAKSDKSDPLQQLNRKQRRDAGKQHVVTEDIAHILRDQYFHFPWWDVRLHTQNLMSKLRASAASAKCPSIASVRRFMHREGLHKTIRPRQDSHGRLGLIVETQLYEVARFEAKYPNELWSLDFHKGKILVLDENGNWKQPIAMVILDHYSRLSCYLKWFFNENTENLVEGSSQSIMMHGPPIAQLSDNGAAMRSAEYKQGLKALNIKMRKIKPKKANQNGKTEVFWATLESKFLSMLVGQEGITLDLLNELSLAWRELGYNRSVHREIKETPLNRYLAAPKVGGSSCDEDTLKRSFRMDEMRTQRRSDHTITIQDVLFRVPQEFWNIKQLLVRYARWDLSFVHLVNNVTGQEVARIFPVDKEGNADGHRKPILKPVKISGDRRRATLPSYMEELVQQYRALTDRPFT